MAFNALGRVLLVSSAWAVKVLVWLGVPICKCPISLSVHRIETAVLALMNNAPSLASAADDITALIICKIMSTAPLLMGMSSVPAMNMWPGPWVQKGMMCPCVLCVSYRLLGK